MRPYPKTCSCSHHSRRRDWRPGPRSPAASRTRGSTAMLLDLELPLDGEDDLLLCPVHGALGGHAVDGLGDHVGHDVVVVDALHRLVRLGRPAARVRVLGLLGQHGELGVPRPDRMVGEVLERRVVEGIRRHDPGVEVLLLEQVSDELLGQLLVLRELPDPHAQVRTRRVNARGPTGAIVMIEVVGDGLLVGERGIVGAHRVVDPGALAREDEAVVARVVPREHLGFHRVLVELLVPLDDGGRLVGDDAGSLAVGLQHLGAVGPRHGPVCRVGVRAVADRDPHRVALLLEHLALLEELIPGLRWVLEPGLLEVSHVIRAGEGDPEPRDGLPARLRLAALRGKVIPAPTLLPDLLDDVVHADEEVLVEERVGAGRPVHVVARLRLRLGGDLGRHLQMRHGIHAHRAVVGLAERFRLLAQLVVGGGDEVVPREKGQLTLLGVGRSPAEGEPRSHAGGGAGRGAEELTSGRDRSIGRFHPGPPCGTMGDRR